jgi:hypothetical protein
MGDALEREDFVEDTIQQTLEPYAPRLPGGAVEEMRDFLSLVLDTHPVGATLVDRARPRRAPEKSGDQPKEKSDAAEEERKKGGGAR